MTTISPRERGPRLRPRISLTQVSAPVASGWSPSWRSRAASSLYLSGIRGLGRLSQLVQGRVAYPEEKCVVTTRHGFRLRIDPIHEPVIDRQLFRHGTYEPATLSVFSKLLHPGDSFIDVGANIGLMTVHGARLIGQQGHVVAVEASRSTFAELEFNIGLNELNNVTAIRVAAGAERGRMPLYLRPTIGSGGATLVDERGSAPGEEVDVLPLDQIVSDVPLSTVSLIKVDVEGFEQEVLRGAPMLLDRHRPVVCMEYSTDGGTRALEAVDFMRSQHGYIVYRTTRRKSALRHGELVPVLNDRQLPTHDNVYLVPRERLTEFCQRTGARTT